MAWGFFGVKTTNRGYDLKGYKKNPPDINYFPGSREIGRRKPVWTYRLERA